VRFTRDGVAVLQHDARLERNTNGSGPLADRTWEELKVLDAGSWRGEAFRGEPLALLADAAALLRSLRMYAHVEVKRVPGRHRECGEGAAREVARAWQGAAEAPLIISFSADALDAARAVEPALPRGWIVQAPWDGDLAPLEYLDAVSLHLEHDLVTPDLVREIHARGRRILAWTVNEAERAQALLDWGVDGIVTDNVGEFARRFRDLL
jgi:glycerophosphoryl diester phosphodiesterase